MQNSRFFSRSVISRLEKSFFKEYFNPLSDSKVVTYSDHERNYCLGDRMFFLEYISDDRDRCPRLLFTDWNRETNADAREWRKLEIRRAGTVFLFVPPK